MKFFIPILLLVLYSCGGGGFMPSNANVVLVTTMGTLEIELYEDDAPITVKNFVSYVESGFFEETIFHRIIPGFVVQGGGHISGMEQKETQEPIQNDVDVSEQAPVRSKRQRKPVEKVTLNFMT